MFGYIDEETPEEITACKTLTQKIAIYCIDSKPETLLERNRILEILTLGIGNRFPKHVEYMTISADTVLKLQEIKKNVENDFKKLYPDCNIIVRDN